MSNQTAIEHNLLHIRHLGICRYALASRRTRFIAPSYRNRGGGVVYGAGVLREISSFYDFAREISCGIFQEFRNLVSKVKEG